MNEAAAMKARRGDTALIFMHIPKTGGSTLNHIIDSHFSRDESYGTSITSLHPEGSLNSFLALKPEQRANLKLLSGHMGFGLHKHLPRSAVYVALLREPIERILSQYSFEHHEPQSPVFAQLRSGELDLKEYVYYYAAAAEMDNLQTRMIAGNWHKRGHGPCTEDMLETAKRNLRERFAVVGLTERFDESYLLCKRVFGWAHTFYIKHNQTRKRLRQTTLSPEDLAYVRRFNRYDLELYTYVQQLFAERVRAQGPSFQAEITLFQAANWIYGLLWKVRSFSLRAFLRRWLAASTA